MTPAWIIACLVVASVAILVIVSAVLKRRRRADSRRVGVEGDFPRIEP